MISKAKEYAVRWHQSNRQKYDESPYTKHLEMVVSVAMNYINYIDKRDRDNVLAACWCHDLIEDTDLTKTQLSDYLNYEIAEIVYAVTNEQSASRYERNILTFSKIGTNNLAVFVKLCDRLANTKNSSQFARVIYNKYQSEFPLFRHFLQNSSMIYHDMWKDLEGLYYLNKDK
jgi:(p)ppGpp synthase/HD superfamily hydrolase